MQRRPPEPKIAGSNPAGRTFRINNLQGLTNPVRGHMDEKSLAELGGNLRVLDECVRGVCPRELLRRPQGDVIQIKSGSILVEVYPSDMSLRLGALHDALLHPGDPDLARKAAEEVAAYEQQLAQIRTDLTLLKWIGGVQTALILLVLGRVWFV